MGVTKEIVKEGDGKTYPKVCILEVLGKIFLYLLIPASCSRKVGDELTMHYTGTLVSNGR